MRVVWATIFLSAGLVTAGGCVSEGTRADVVTLGYRSCRASEPVPVFELSIAQDGAIRYAGSAIARIQGEQTARIDAPVARRIRVAVAQAVRESHTRYTPRPKVPEDVPTLCLTAGDSSARTELNSGRERARKLIDLINQTIDPRRWACPTAQFAGADSLNFEYCGRPRVVADFTDERSCELRNFVEVYADGQLHVYVGGAGRGRASHQFASLSSADLQKVLDLARTCVVTGELTGSPGAPEHRLCGRPEDLRAFRDLVSQLAAPRWADGRAGGASCASANALPRGELRLVAPFADGNWSKTYQP